MSLHAPTFSRAGFTLIEVMVALAFMAIAFVAVWGVHYSSLKADIRTDLETGAVAAAYSQLDFLRIFPFTDALLSDGNHSSNAADPPLPAAFTRSYSVVTDPSLPWKKTVTVVVRWTERTGGFGASKVSVPKSVQMSSMLVDLN